MLTLTERAAEALRDFQEEQGSGGAGVRLALERTEEGLWFSLNFQEEPQPGDTVLDTPQGIRVFVAPEALPHCRDLRLDFQQGAEGGFLFQRTDLARLREEVEAALEAVRPMLVRDGGNIQLVEVTPDAVRLRFQGACVGCPGAAATLKHGVERAIRQRVPGPIRILAA